jgi:hypothetical protein
LRDWRKYEVWRQNAGDRQWPSVEHNVATDQLYVSAEEALPHAV